MLIQNLCAKLAETRSSFHLHVRYWHVASDVKKVVLAYFFFNIVCLEADNYKKLIFHRVNTQTKCVTLRKLILDRHIRVYVYLLIHVSCYRNVIDSCMHVC